MQAANSIGTSLDFFLFVAFALFTIGAIGAMTRKNMIVLLMCIELMLNAVNLSFVALSSQIANIDGQVVVFFVLVVAAAEVVVGLGIIVSIMRRRTTLTVDDMSGLKG